MTFDKLKAKVIFVTVIFVLMVLLGSGGNYMHFDIETIFRQNRIFENVKNVEEKLG